MKILHFADLHLGVESYGRPDPATGLSTRLLDFLGAFDKLVEYALSNDVDLVLFCGDAYKSREPTPTQQREFARRINRLSRAGIPVFLLVGNHDLPNGMGRATSTEIFDTLSVSNVYVAGRPAVHKISTRSGIVQVAALPWLRRGAMLARTETANMTLEQVTNRMQEALTNIIHALAAGIDPTLPSILAGHGWVSGATLGSERAMVLGQEHVLLLGNMANPVFDYVALGHIHRRQALFTNPPVVYSGSLARLDFGEEADDKGFYIVEIGNGPGKRPVSCAFHPVSSRRFLTIEVDISAEELDPTSPVMQLIAGKSEQIKDAIVRLQVSLPQELAGQLREGDIRESLKEAHYFNIATTVRREARLRLGNIAAGELTPIDALKMYLKSSNTPEERAGELVEYGRRIIESGE